MAIDCHRSVRRLESGRHRGESGCSACAWCQARYLFRGSAVQRSSWADPPAIGAELCVTSEEERVPAANGGIRVGFGRQKEPVADGQGTRRPRERHHFMVCAEPVSGGGA